MKTFVVLLTAILALGLLASPVVAASHEMKGDIKAVDPNGKTFTLEEHKLLRGKKEQTFQVTDRTLLSGLRPGERVMVTYDKQGTQMIARAVDPVAKKK